MLQESPIRPQSFNVRSGDYEGQAFEASACLSPLQEGVCSSNEHQSTHQSISAIINIHSLFSNLEEMKIEVEVRAGTTDDEVIAENALKQRIAEMYADLKLLKKQDGKITLLMEQTAENNAKDKAITKPKGVRKKQKGETFCGTRCMCETNDKEKSKEQDGRSSPENLMSDKNELKDEAKMPKATKTMETQGCSKTNGLRPQHATDHCPVGLVQDCDDLWRCTDVLTDMRPLLKGPKTAPI